jgi:glycosyltransferase involved in cell wall biosynthesis
MNPLITYFLFAYNQEKYIEEACRSAFSQTYSPLQIIISDDCSTDLTYEIVSRLVDEYRGPHQVIARRNKSNLGLVGHVNKSFEVSGGEIIVAAAGDDISLPERVEAIKEIFDDDKNALLVHSAVIAMDEQGKRIGELLPPIRDKLVSLDKMSIDAGVYIGATGAWKKSIYRQYGPIIEKHAFEDGVLGFRAALSGGLRFLNKPLVLYRRNIGVSSFIDKGGLRSKIQLERKRLLMLKGLMSQRLVDFEQVKASLGSDVAQSVVNAIAIELAVINMRHSLYTAPADLLKEILNNKIMVTKMALGGEIKSLIKYLWKYYVVLNKKTK